MSLPASALEHIRHLYSLADKDQKRAFVDWMTSEASAEKPGVLTSVEKAMPILSPVTTCPRCGGTQFVKNGKRNGRQRLICKQCNRTVGLTQDTPMFATKKSYITWKTFVHCMETHKSIRRTASMCNISLPTACAWKRKYLQAMGNVAKSMVRRLKEQGQVKKELDWPALDRIIKENIQNCYKARYTRRKPSRPLVFPGDYPVPRCPERNMWPNPMTGHPYSY